MSRPRTTPSVPNTDRLSDHAAVIREFIEHPSGGIVGGHEVLEKFAATIDDTARRLETALELT